MLSFYVKMFMVISMIKFFKNANVFDYCDYIHNKMSPGLTKKKFPVCFFKIVSLFADDCHNQIISLNTFHNNLEIKGSYKGIENELMLRYKYADDNIGLVIARIQFINQRNGNLTNLIKILSDISIQYELGEIMIECANSDEIKNWIKKNDWVEYRCEGNYVSREALERINNKKEHI